MKPESDSMRVLFRQLLETALFNVNDGHNIALLPQPVEPGEANGAARARSHELTLPDDVIPANTRLCRLPQSEAFLPLLADSIPTDQPIRLFLFPPLLGRRDLSDPLRAQFPLMDLWEIVLIRVTEIVAPGSLIAALLPGSVFFNESSSRTRARLSEIAYTRLIIAQSHPPALLGLELHAAFQMGTVLLEKDTGDERPIRFFRCPPVNSDVQRSDALEDFTRLLKQSGGKTKHGYILREKLLPGASWLYDTYRPDLVKRAEDLAHLGGLQTLGDLVEVKRSIHRVSDADLFGNPTEDRGVVLVDGRDITSDGRIQYEEPRQRVVIPEEWQLRPGDICVRAFQGNQSRLVCAVVGEDSAPLVASDSVIVLRPRVKLTDSERDFLLAYLRSSACAELLRSRGLGLHIVLSRLLRLPVPVADDALHLAVDSLGKAASQFRAWAEELDAVRGLLFDSQSARDARINALSLGRLAKQRYEAATLVSDFKQRVRTRFPYPVAFRWRTVESQHPTLEGYIQTLECAEVTVTYLAIMALLLAQCVNKPIEWLGTMARRISSTGHGTNMGDWSSILHEAGGSGFAKDIPDTAPFVEVSRFLSDAKVKKSLSLLADWRNAQAHGRGPKGADVPPAFDEARNELAVLLQAAEFVTDYRLRYIEATRRDTLQKVTHYEYRELMGDHAIVPVAQARTSDAETEASSLYLLDRAGKLHLLRPLMIGRDCPVCHSWGTFFLDTCLRDGKAVVLKSMEHGHTIQDTQLLEPLRACGLLA